MSSRFKKGHIPWHSGTGIKVITGCPSCKKQFTDYKCNKRKFCSSSCAAKMTLNWIGKKHSLETRKKISEANYRRFKNEELHPRWKGDSVGYRTLHKWVEKHLGKPHLCQECGDVSLSHRHYHWANVSGDYLRITSDWRRLCAKCHKAFDGRAKSLNV